MVPNITYQVNIGNESLAIDLDSAGNFASSSNSIAANPVGSSIVFGNAPIDIITGDYQGLWALTKTTLFTSGSANGLILVPGLKYFLNIGEIGNFSFDIDASGNLTNLSNSAAADISGDQLTLNTFLVSVSTSNTSAPWQITRVTPTTVTGSADVFLVPGVNYWFADGAVTAVVFSVSSPCALAPSSIDLNGDIFNLSCANEFSCEKKMDYDQNLSCDGTFEANSQAELDAYLADFGASSENYKSLFVDFDLSSQKVEIHSPCEIELVKAITIASDETCIDGKGGVQINKASMISSGPVTLLSEQNDIKISKDTEISATELIIDAGVDVIVNKDVSIDAETISIASGADTLFSKNSTITSDEMSAVAANSLTIQKDSIFNITNQLLLSGNSCSINNSAQINSGSQAGTCSPF